VKHRLSSASSASSDDDKDDDDDDDDDDDFMKRLSKRPTKTKVTQRRTSGRQRSLNKGYLLFACFISRLCTVVSILKLMV